MKKTTLILLVITLLASCGLFEPKKEKAILVFSKTDQFRHESIEAGQAAIQKLGSDNGFKVDLSEDASIFNEKNLKNYNVVVFLNTTGDILDNGQQLEFNRFIQAGGGFVGIHAAADTEYQWPWYGGLVGAYFNGHPNDPNVRDAVIRRLDSQHESTASLPDDWSCTDEWYNYKDIQSDLTVLLNLDETTYEGGTNGENHPIAWYHEYDGGRAWYTGRGHTIESFSEDLFLQHLLGGIQYAAGEWDPVDYNNANIAPEENRFNARVLDDYLNEPMELDMLPNGNIIFIQRHGQVYVFDMELDSSILIQEIEVFSGLEDGLLGLALDPDIVNNQWIYLFHSDPEESFQRISRFTMGDDFRSVDMNSMKTLLTIPTQRDECCHSGGSLEFGPNGNLFISVGDNTNPHASDGYSPSDEREGRSPWDAQKSSANPNDLRGKILRIKPETDGTYSIPDGNLFAPDQEGTRPEIYVMGNRNPFRISVDQRNGDLYWGEVGPDAGKDSVGRGPRGYDEVNKATEAGFFGWPYFIADNKPYNRYDFETETQGDLFNVNAPKNMSPNNTGISDLPPAQPAFIWYPYAVSEDFPQVGEGGRNAMAGPVFYVEDYPENERRFPRFYDGQLFAYDWMRGWIMTVSMDEEGKFKKMTRFMPSTKFANPTDIIFSPEGDIFMLEYGTVWFSANPDARLLHITYNGGNRKPVAKIVANKSVGGVPLNVTLDGSESIDFDGDDLSYQWYIEGSDEAFSTDQSTTFTFDQAGEYTIRLVTTDTEDESDETAMDFMVGNELPVVSWKFEGNRSFYWDNQSLAYEVNVSDVEDGTIGNGIDESQVVVSIDYLERGYDATESALGHQAMVEASAFAVGKQLMDGSDCSTCHQMDVKSVGPTYIDIAKKYEGDDSAPSYLATKIISGGGGVWGDLAMAAHPQLAESEATQMAKYILSLSGEDAQGMPSKGTYVMNQHETGNTEGKYILTASYTDKGGDVIGGLTARDVVVLRNPLMFANEYTSLEKAMRFTVDPEMSQGMFQEEMDIVIGEDGGFVMYDNIDLTGIKGITINVAKAGTFFSGGKIKVRLDDPSAEPVAEFVVDQGMVEFGNEEITAPLNTEGKHDIYLTFESDGDKAVTALITLYFDNTAPNM